jgi:Fe-S-cluster containining protein
MKPTDVPHSPDEDGYHDEESCYACAAVRRAVATVCRCAECCRHLILEALPQDALVEPRIKEWCEEVRDFPDDEPGYLLNGPDGPCVFLDQRTNLCTIYETRPLMCRLFNCDGQDRDKLIELGIAVHATRDPAGANPPTKSATAEKKTAGRG